MLLMSSPTRNPARVVRVPRNNMAVTVEQVLLSTMAVPHGHLAEVGG
jgi:hypothetical protein